MYIALSGTDGCGKTTASIAVEQWLQQNQPKEIVKVHEYSGTPEADAIRQIILHTEGVEFTLKQELLLITAARDSMQEKLIIPALNEDKHVLSDRCFLCSKAYQVDSDEQLELFNFLHEGMVLPDIIILVDLDVDIADKRIGDRERDTIEKKGKGYQAEVRERFLQVAEKNPFVIKVSSDASPEEVQQNVIQKLTEATITQSPLSIVIVNDVVTYYGAGGYTNVPVEVVYERLIGYGYTFSGGENGELWGAKHGYAVICSEMLNEYQAIKMVLADAIRRGFWNEPSSSIRNSGEIDT